MNRSIPGARVLLLAFLLSLAAWPLRAQTVTPPPIAARAFLLVDLLSGQTLAAAAEDERFEPASLTKLMTAYVVFTALREGRLDASRPLPVPEKAARAPGARMFVVPGKPVAVMDLLRGMIVQSANDAALVLAEAVGGSEQGFVAMMNAHARRLGLADAAFANPTGQPAPGHHASARDLAMLAAALVRDFPEHYPLYSEKEFTYNGMMQANRNRLLWTDATVEGMKTGFTESAGYCLLATARRDGRRLVAVVLGARSDTLRTSETQKLLNFGFQAYDTRRLYRKGEAVASAPVYKGTQSGVRLGFDRDIWLTLPRDRFEGLAAVLETRRPFLAPLAAGQKAGIMKLTRGEATLAEIPVVALEDVPVAGFLSRGWDTLRLLFSN